MNHTIVVVLALISASALGDGTDADRKRLDDARIAWDASGVVAYSYTLKSSDPFGHTIYRIVVDEKMCHANSRVTFGTTTARWTPVSCEGHTIPELLTELRRRLNMPHTTVDLSLDSNVGYPHKFTTDTTELTDSEWTGEISAFKIIRRRAPN